jgi:hypothetical protein
MTLSTALYLAGAYWLICIAFICLCKKILP